MNDYSAEVLRPYKTFEKTIDGQQIYAINFTEGEFSHIMFSYGRVEFIEDEENDKLITKFDYTVHESKKEYNKKKFEKELGDFLIEMIVNGLLKHNLVYTGGIEDEQIGDSNITSSNNG